jgi:hypothetical protein
MPQTTPHEWFKPKLTALIAEAEAAGITRDVSVGVITDLVNGPLFSTAPLQNEENWNQDIGEPDYHANINAPQAAEPIDVGGPGDSLPFVPRGNWT